MSKFRLIPKEIPAARNSDSRIKSPIRNVRKPRRCRFSGGTLNNRLPCSEGWSVSCPIGGCKRGGCLHGLVSRYRASSPVAVSRRRIPVGLPGGCERCTTVPVLGGGRQAGISGHMAVLDHAGGQSQRHQVLVSGDARKPCAPYRDSCRDAVAAAKK